MDSLLLKLFSIIFLFNACSIQAQVVPIGQFFVGDSSQKSAGCDVSLKSEKSLRAIQGCYHAQLNKKRACEIVKYHREIEQCCPSPYTDVAVAVVEAHGIRPQIEPCHRVQVLYHNYCIDVPSYSLVEGCKNKNGCGVEFALQSEIDSDNNTTTETRIAINDCFTLKTEIYKGPILPGCYNIESSSVPERKCIRVKRNVPYKVCCNKYGIDTGANNDGTAVDSKQSFNRPCTQYQEIESEYCFDIPYEAAIKCTDIQGQPYCTTMFICRKCPKEIPFTSKILLIEHNRRKHIINRRFECHICEKRFTTNFNKKVHIDRVHKLSLPPKKYPYKCDSCLNIFECESKMTRHICSHTEDKSFICEICSKAFARIYLLASHRQFCHSDTTPFVCPTCGEKFVTKQDLVTHFTIHPVEKP